MARTIDGTSSILQFSRGICRIVGRFGTVRFGNKTTPEFEAAVAALVLACQAFDALEDAPGEIDIGGGDGPEDVLA